MIATVYTKNETKEQLLSGELIANAKLIAAAPELLDFIIRWLNEQTIEGVNGNYPGGSFGWKAQQLIKKATE